MAVTHLTIYITTTYNRQWVGGLLAVGGLGAELPPNKKFPPNGWRLQNVDSKRLNRVSAKIYPQSRDR